MTAGPQVALMIDDLGVGFNQINIMTILDDAVLLYYPKQNVDV